MNKSDLVVKMGIITNVKSRDTEIINTEIADIKSKSDKIRDFDDDNPENGNDVDFIAGKVSMLMNERDLALRFINTQKNRSIMYIDTINDIYNIVKAKNDEIKNYLSNNQECDPGVRELLVSISDTFVSIM